MIINCIIAYLIMILLLLFIDNQVFKREIYALSMYFHIDEILCVFQFINNPPYYSTIYLHII